MFADFNKAFFKDNEKETKIPKEVLITLSENLPDGFEYTELEDGLVGIVPQKTDIEIGGIKFNLKDKVFKEFTPANSDEAKEFLYRTQRKYEINLTDEDSITINGTSFVIGEIIEKPFKEITKKTHKLSIKPQPFRPPFEVYLEGNGVKKNFLVERQPYADMNKSLFKSNNDENFEISYLLDEKELQLQFNFRLNIDNAIDVWEAIEGLKLYHSCITGNIKLNGEEISNIKTNHSDEITVIETIKFWEKVLNIQDVLNVKFSPKSKLEMEDVEIIEQLYRTLIEKKPFKEFIKINEMTFKGIKEMNIEDLLELEGLSFSFQQTSELEVLGAKIELFSLVSIFDFRVENFKPLREDEQSYILFLEPIEGKKIYQSTIHFRTKSDSDNYKMDVNVLQNADVITIN
ncbi:MULTISPECIES: abortive infection system toxin AbiGii family protein [Lysinibacillus]|uniref:abortive infection system toxin AbiGii family protein n=1 Tax=Lysinibacillus TaxID=400634 RepID=UPI0025939E2F|nr:MULTISPECIES: abortive infection system toxin AbiGii family protein [Lysinibacillus]